MLTSRADAADTGRAGQGRDYFKEIGVRPFINAAGTFTAMTASLMPDEVMAAINYASKHFVMLDELHDRVGERIASLVGMRGGDGHLWRRLGADPRHRRRADRHGHEEDRRAARPHEHEERGHHPEVAPLRLRPRRAQLRRAASWKWNPPDDLAKAVNEKTAMMLFYNNNNGVGRIRDEEFVRLGKQHGIPTMNDCAADVPPVDNLWKYTRMGFDLVAFSGGKGIRGPQSAGLLLGPKPLIAAARLNGPPNSDTHRPRHEGEQGRAARDAGRARDCTSRRITRPSGASSSAAPR